MIQAQALPATRAASAAIDTFESLMRRYDRKVYSIAYRMTGNAEDAKDLAQEAFVRAYRSLGSFRPDTSFERWLFRIVTNLCIDHLRKVKRRPTVSYEEPVELEDRQVERSLPDWSYNPESIVVNRELGQKIQAALLQLPPEFRMAVVLCDVQGFSYEEIAGILRCSIGTVRSRIHRGRKLLRARLKPYVTSGEVSQRR